MSATDKYGAKRLYGTRLLD